MFSMIAGHWMQTASIQQLLTVEVSLCVPYLQECVSLPAQINFVDVTYSNALIVSPPPILTSKFCMVLLHPILAKIELV